MKLYEIKEEFMKLFDEETGEIYDIEALEKLEMAEEEKIRNIICQYKQLMAEASLLKAEEQNLAKRRKARENSAEWLLNYVDKHLEGRDYETTEGKLSHRKSTKCEMTDELAFLEWDQRFMYGKSEFIANKKDIGDAIKNGIIIPGWSRVDYMNASIK